MTDGSTVLWRVATMGMRWLGTMQESVLLENQIRQSERTGKLLPVGFEDGRDEGADEGLELGAADTSQ